MSLFCLRCGVYAYRNHNPACTRKLIPLSPVCKSLAMQLDQLGLEPLSAGCFITPVADSAFEHRITFNVEFRNEIPPVLVLPVGWTYYDEIVGTDIKISSIGYSEVYVWLNEHTPSARAYCIAQSLETYLSQYDKDALKVVLTFYNTGVVGAQHVK